MAPCLNTTWRRNNESHHTFESLSYEIAPPFDCESKTTVSRLEISNHRSLVQHIAQLRNQANTDRHRALLVIQNPPGGYLQTLATAIDAPFLAPEDTSDRADRITNVLGREFDTLVHETAAPVDAGLLAALTGTIRAGGILILGLPCKLTGAAHRPTAKSDNRFQQRLARLLLQCEQEHSDKIGVISLTEAAKSNDAAPATDLSRIGKLPAGNNAPLESAAHEQDDLLLAATRHLQRYPDACLTITGRRGRGKSALLGRIAQWLVQQEISVAMTAARRSALLSVEKQGVDIPFFAASEAADSGCRALLVDEAASLPIDTLTRYLQHHEHVVYCTTIEGYEQAGRAFDIRFTDMIAQLPRKVLALHPGSAWRWAPGDPLEAFIDTLLLARQTDTEEHDRKPCAAPTGDPLDPAMISKKPDQTDLRIRRLDRDELVQNESLLAEVFSLLRESHYQTTASDISHVLDGPDLQIWVLEEQQAISAALLLAVEGKMDARLHEAVLSKQRRLPHQLLPQLLAQSANRAAPLEASMARIIRIAVCPHRRRRGLGSRLLQELARAVARPVGSLSALGASFAGDSAKLDFWQANGFTRFHTGYRRNPRTGTRAVAVLKAFDTSVDAALQRAARIHDDNRGWLQGSTLNTVKDPADEELLHRFASSQRSLTDTYAAMSRLALHYPINLNPTEGTSRRQHEAELRAFADRYLKSASALAQQ